MIHEMAFYYIDPALLLNVTNTLQPMDIGLSKGLLDSVAVGVISVILEEDQAPRRYVVCPQSVAIGSWLPVAVH